MLENNHADAPPSIASLVGGILADGQKLVRQEVALARREIAETADKAKTGAALLGSAHAVCIVGGVLLGIMVAKLLQQFLLPNHEWACFGIVGAVFALAGGVLVYCGRSKLNEVNLSFPQTSESLREDVQAVGAAVSEGRAAADGLLKR
jgi:Putative Actinobacterial Holin-X, holin superfamily III